MKVNPKEYINKLFILRSNEAAERFIIFIINAKIADFTDNKILIDCLCKNKFYKEQLFNPKQWEELNE